jgi:hypothetical protein
VIGSALAMRFGIALLVEIVALPLLAVAVAFLYAIGLPGMEAVHAAILLFLLSSLVLLLRKRRPADAMRAGDNG